MASFQSTTVLIFSVLLIVIFVTIAISLHIAKKKEKWPPIIAQCPDYWIDDSINGSKCVNIKNLGNCKSSKTMDFNTPYFRGSDGTCNKYKWAKSCDLTWDGITYGVANPCIPPNQPVTD